MFSGIVEELGRVTANRIVAEGRLDIAGAAVLVGVRTGDSIAVNGCCLTVLELGPGTFTVDVMPESAMRTNLGDLITGSAVNLEASLRLGDRIGGHMVSGHVDATGVVTALREDGNARWVTVSAPRPVMALLVGKGCVAIDGISLTVVDVTSDAFTVSLIPHTLAVTTAGAWAAGTVVNLEADLMAKYVATAVAAQLAGR